MSESTFLCFMYIYMLIVKDKYPDDMLRDFKKHAVKVFKEVNCLSAFALTFLSDCLEYPQKQYKLSRNFIRFLKENNQLLSY